MSIENEDELKFIMQVGYEVKKIIISSLNKKYSNNPTKMKNMFMNIIVNCMVNIVNDVSTDDFAFQQNLKLIINNLNTFFDNINELQPVIYNPITDKLGETH